MNDTQRAAALRLAEAKLAACMASRDALRDWAQECRDQVLYLLAQRDDELGRTADGLGQASVGLLRELAEVPVQEPVAEIFDTFGNSQDPTKCQGKVWLAPGYFPPRGTKLYASPQQQQAEPVSEPGVEYKRGYEEALNDCIRNGIPWARSMFANNAEHIKPVQEPAIWIQSNHLQHAKNGPYLARTAPTKLMSDFIPLYAAPQQRQPLSYEQILAAAGRLPGWLRHHEELDCDDLIDFARAVEKAHGIGEEA